MKLTRPSEKFHRPETPTHMKLFIAGAACLAVGIERRIFLLLGAGLLAFAYLSWRGEQQRLS